MDIPQAKKQYLSLPKTSKRFVLASLAHQLTISARSAYLPEYGLEERFNTLQAFNEIQHQVSAQLDHKLTGAESYPDDVFLDIVFEVAGKAGCERGVLWALDRALASLQHAPQRA